MSRTPILPQRNKKFLIFIRSSENGLQCQVAWETRLFIETGTMRNGPVAQSDFLRCLHGRLALPLTTEISVLRNLIPRTTGSQANFLFFLRLQRMGLLMPHSTL